MADWKKTEYGHHLVAPEGSAFIGLWLNPSFVYGVIFFRGGYVMEVPHSPDHHEPFEGVKYTRASDRMKAVIESLLRPKVDVRPTQWDRLGEDE